MAAICVFCASSRTLDQRWLDLAAETGAELARRGHTLVSGGGCVGMMGALADGARSAGGRTVGVIPQSLVDLEVADLASDELLVTDSMASRKTLMIDKSDAFLTLPGGLGTLDELFEVWTTATLALHAKPMVLIDTDGFYRPLLDWLDALADQTLPQARRPRPPDGRHHRPRGPGRPGVPPNLTPRPHPAPHPGRGLGRSWSWRAPPSACRAANLMIDGGGWGGVGVAGWVGGGGRGWVGVVRV